MEDKIFNQNLTHNDSKNEPKLGFTHELEMKLAHGYYRSRIFNLNYGPNQLLNAAAPLFSLASRLPRVSPPLHRDKFLNTLVHEIKAFENKAQIFRYHSNIILAARYSLCSLLDDIIKNTSWGHDFNWENENLLQTFHHEASGNERFFVILNRALEDPVIHLDLLELIYFCLNLGFTGKYRQKESDRDELSFITNNLYHCLTQYRGEAPKSLCLTASVTDEKKINAAKNVISWWLIIASILLINALIFVSFDWHLKTVSKPLLEAHELIN